MYFPKYWAKDSFRGKNRKGRAITVSAFGWSSVSVEEARKLAKERARKYVERGISADRGGGYEYGLAPMREEVLERIQSEGQEVGVVTRNRYGALVLNTADVMFVDIDYPASVSTGFWDSVCLAFSAKRRRARAKLLKTLTVEEVEAWANRNPTHPFRLYETHSGLRLLMTGATHNPKSEESKRLLRDLKADPLYCALTERQECYRARLTPKPWRCDASKPPSYFPWESEAEESRYRDWEAEYSKVSSQYATCRLKREYGGPAAAPRILEVIRVHDAMTLAGEKTLA